MHERGGRGDVWVRFYFSIVSTLRFNWLMNRNSEVCSRRASICEPPPIDRLSVHTRVHSNAQLCPSLTCCCWRVVDDLAEMDDAWNELSFDFEPAVQAALPPTSLGNTRDRFRTQVCIQYENSLRCCVCLYRCTVCNSHTDECLDSCFQQPTPTRARKTGRYARAGFGCLVVVIIVLQGRVGVGGEMERYVLL